MGYLLPGKSQRTAKGREITNPMSERWEPMSEASIERDRRRNSLCAAPSISGPLQLVDAFAHKRATEHTTQARTANLPVRAATVNARGGMQRTTTWEAIVLHNFLTTNRSELIDRCRQKVARRTPPPGRSFRPSCGVGSWDSPISRSAHRYAPGGQESKPGQEPENIRPARGWARFDYFGDCGYGRKAWSRVTGARI